MKLFAVVCIVIGVMGIGARVVCAEEAVSYETIRKLLDAARQSNEFLPPEFQKLYSLAEEAEGHERQALWEAVLRSATVEKPDEGFAMYAIGLRLPVPLNDRLHVALKHAFSENEELRRVCTSELQLCLGIESSISKRYYDFSALGAVLRSAGPGEVTDNALRYMFQRSPSAAFEVMAYHDADAKLERQTLFIMKDEAELAITKCRAVFRKGDPNLSGLVEDAEKSLLRLSKRDPWWCKLYVAETLARNADMFKDHEKFPELAKEKHPFIREAMDRPFDEGIIHYRVPAKLEFRP
jgi:hypothetical protein